MSTADPPAGDRVSQARDPVVAAVVTIMTLVGFAAGLVVRGLL